MKDDVMNVVLSAIDEINEQLLPNERLEKSHDTELSGKLDSLALVNFIVAIEQRVEEEYDKLINLVDAQTISEGSDPFKTVETLAEYISAKLEE